MKKILFAVSILVIHLQLTAQTEPDAGKWTTWFIPSGEEYRLSPPASTKDDITKIIDIQKNLDEKGRKEIMYWNAGAPGYRWQHMMANLWMTDISNHGVLANMLLSVATYDATVAAWDTKYSYKSKRPFEVDPRINVYGVRPESSSYPCEYSVAAGVAVTIIAHFYPTMTDSVMKMADQVMTSRIAAGVAFPEDTRAGFALGKKIALHEIEHTKDFTTKDDWDGIVPQGPAYWKGKNPMLVLAGRNKTVVLDSSSQYRPAPPPDFAADMEEVRQFKQTYRSKSNAFYYASQSIGGGDDLLNTKIFEQNLHLNAPRAARIYAGIAVAVYDGFTACWDAKYAYWGIRPDQYDTTYQALLPTPPFPGYPSGHALMSGIIGELYSYFFPADRAIFQKRAKEGAESRFFAGIHFRSDNDAGLALGQKIANEVIRKIQLDGADDNSKFH